MISIPGSGHTPRQHPSTSNDDINTAAVKFVIVLKRQRKPPPLKAHRLSAGELKSDANLSFLIPVTISSKKIELRNASTKRIANARRSKRSCVTR